MSPDAKTVLVVGASSGFGKLVAHELLDRGYTVYAAARRTGHMEDLGTKGAHVLEMDVTDGESVRAGVERMFAEQGRIDVLLANASYGPTG